MKLSLALSACGLAAGAVAAGCPYAERNAARDLSSAPHALPRTAVSGKKGIFYMNRIGPSGARLHIANADGTDAEDMYKNGTGSASLEFAYHASWSQDGEWITYTTEVRGPGQSDIWRVRTNGSDAEALVETDWLEDAGVLSPDSTKLAYVSTKGNWTTNIWVKDLTTGDAYNLTNTATTVSNNVWMSGHYRPSWSPDGEWIAFSSDRERDWTGHSAGVGWEHTQQLGIFIIRPNGSDFKTIQRITDRSLGTPAWSSDSKRLIYNYMTRENTYFSHCVESEEEEAVSHIYSVDIATGKDVVKHDTPGDLLRVSQHYIADTENIGYVIKAGDHEGINYTITTDTHKAFTVDYLRNPSWSPNGTRLVYEIPNWTQQPNGLSLWDFDADWDYRYIDVFPLHNKVVNRITNTQKVEGGANGSAISSNVYLDDVVTSLNSYSIYSEDNSTEVTFLTEGEAGAFQPSWNPDGTEMIVGFGAWFEERSVYPGALWRVAENGSFQYNITEWDSDVNIGFPSWSPDGSAVVYRQWSLVDESPKGLWILNLTTNETTQLTDGWDNTPGWSPDGELIVFTRNDNWTVADGPRWYADRFDIFTIKPDGTGLNRVTDSLSNDAHAVWRADGKIMWSSGMYGFMDESALYDNTFQPYGHILIMDADGSNKRPLTDSLWEDAMPLYMPNEYL